MNPGHLSKSRKTDATSLNLYLFCSGVLWVYRQEPRTAIKGSELHPPPLRVYVHLLLEESL